MGRKSSIDRLPQEVRKRARQLLRDNQLTLDEIREQIKEEFGVDYVPSRTPLWREKQKIEQWAKDARELETIADVWVRELKDRPSGKTGRMVLELLRTMAFQAVGAAREKQTIDPKEIWALARAFNLIETGGKRNIETESKLREETKAELLREQAAKIDTLVKEGGLSAETANAFRMQLLGVKPKRPPPEPTSA
jgi:hypothetical protein